MDSEIMVEALPLLGMCNLCLNEGAVKSMLLEHKHNGKTEVYSEMLVKCFTIDISILELGDTKRLICELCISRLRDCVLFREQVESSFNTLESTFKLHKGEKRDSDGIKREITLNVDLGDDYRNDDLDDDDENDDDDDDIDWTTPDVVHDANDKPVPSKSREKYLAAWENFIGWKKTKEDQTLTENLFLEYFNLLANKYKPNTLWSIFSMLKSMVRDNDGTDIKKYSKLLDFLRLRSEGYTSRKSKILSSSDVERFLIEAPDNQYLATKVALIFAVTGACRREDLRNITTDDIKDDGQTLQVTVHTRKKNPRTFVIDGPCYTIVKKYTALRSKNTKKTLFFQQYLKGRCTVQPIGVNKFGKMPGEIAKYLGLPDAESYTGHTFTRTSFALWADSDPDTTSKGHKRKSQTKVNKLEPVAKKTEIETVPSTSYITVTVPPMATTYNEINKNMHTTSTVYIKQEVEEPSTTDMPSSSTPIYNDNLNNVVVGPPATVKMELDDHVSYVPSFQTEIKIEKSEIG